MTVGKKSKVAALLGCLALVAIVLYGAVWGFYLDADVKCAVQSAWRAAQYSAFEPLPGSDFSQKSVYQTLSASEQALYRELYQAASLHEEEVLVMGYDTETIWRVFGQMEYDCPELFYLRDTPTVVTTTHTGIVERSCKTVKIPYVCDAETAAARQDELRGALAEFESQIAADASDHDRAESARQWVLDHATYDPDAEDMFDMYGALVDGRTACGGYAQACTWLMRCAGVTCDTVVGYADPGDGQLYGHAWNRVWLDGAWSYLDATWDDGTRQSRTYSFVSQEIMDLKHFPFENNVVPDGESVVQTS